MISEKPVVFGRGGTLVGMLTRAPADAAIPAAPTAIFLNAGIIHRVGPNRLYVNLARSLAVGGMHSLRFDLGGIGDSATNRTEQGSVMDLVERDIADAIDLASKENPAGVVLIGLCSGADNAFLAAAADPRVVGTVLIDPNAHRPRSFYFHRYRRALLQPRTWRLLLTGAHPVASRLSRLLRAPKRRLAASSTERPEQSRFLAPSTLMPRDQMRLHLGRMTERGCRLLYVFTGGLPMRYNHQRQFWNSFPDLRANGRLQLRYFGAWDHTFSDPGCQETLAEMILRWGREGFERPQRTA